MKLFYIYLNNGNQMILECDSRSLLQGFGMVLHFQQTQQGIRMSLNPMFAANNDNIGIVEQHAVTAISEVDDKNLVGLFEQSRKEYLAKKSGLVLVNN